MDTTQQTIFHHALAFVLDQEGGYVNDTDDRGGETHFGISKRAHPDLDIANLTRDQAADIYARDYWLANNCHKLPPVFAFALFDATVNHRRKSAVAMLQESLGVKPDGINGPVTQAAARAVKDPGKTLTTYLKYRAKLYFDIARADSTQDKYINGWLGRLFRLHWVIGRTVA